MTGSGSNGSAFTFVMLFSFAAHVRCSLFTSCHVMSDYKCRVRNEKSNYNVDVDQEEVAYIADKQS